MEKNERVVSVVIAQKGGLPGSALVVTIPESVRRLTGANKGSRFAVKLDSKRRVIYELIPSLEKKK